VLVTLTKYDGLYVLHENNNAKSKRPYKGCSHHNNLNSRCLAYVECQRRVTAQTGNNLIPQWKPHRAYGIVLPIRCCGRGSQYKAEKRHVPFFVLGYLRLYTCIKKLEIENFRFHYFWKKR